jgi:hypothetical protein
VVWNVDPLPFSVPLSLAAALLVEVAVLVDVLVAVGLLDEEHAAMERAVATQAIPADRTLGLRRSCMFGCSFMFSAVTSAIPGGRSS